MSLDAFTFKRPLAECGDIFPTFTLGFARVGFSFCMGIAVFRFYEDGRAALLGRGKLLPAAAFAVVFLLGGMLLMSGRIAEQHVTQLFFGGGSLSAGRLCSVASQNTRAAEPSAVFWVTSPIPFTFCTNHFCWFGADIPLIGCPRRILWPLQLSIPIFCFAVAGIIWCVGASTISLSEPVLSACDTATVSSNRESSCVRFPYLRSLRVCSACANNVGSL